MIVRPVTLIYTAAVYWVFRGKVQPMGEYEGDDLDEVRPSLGEATVSAELARRQLAVAIAALKGNLTPAHMLEDAGRAGLSTAGDVVRRGAAIARTPEGAAAIGLGAVSLLRAFLKPRPPGVDRHPFAHAAEARHGPSAESRPTTPQGPAS